MVGGKFHFEVKLKKIYQKIIGVIIIFSVFCIFMTEELLFGSNFSPRKSRVPIDISNATWGVQGKKFDANDKAHQV